MLAIEIGRTGGPEVLVAQTRPIPEPGPGEVRVRHTAIGLNFIDTYQRSGLYPIALPATLGLEAAGVVDACGVDVERVRVGDRVAYNNCQGAYAEYNVTPATRLVRLPDAIADDTAAAVMLKGLTAEFLVRRLWTLAKGDCVLVYAAAGGVGSLLCQWAAHLGLRVIGVVGHADKVETAFGNGCSEVLRTDEGPVAPRVRRLTQGRGVRVVYDSIGRDTFDDSLAAVGLRGLLVSFGNASGPAPAVEPARLNQAGSVFLTRPKLFDYVATVEELDAASAELFAVLASDAVKVEIGARFPLADVRQAHEALEHRRTTGSTLLIP